MASKYERVLRNPKGDLIVGVPTLTPIPTQKQRLTARAIVKCNSTSTNELKLKWCPHAILCNDVDIVRVEGGVVVGAVGVGLRGNSKYSNTKFLTDLVKGRLVAATLEVQAVGSLPNGSLFGGYGYDGRRVDSYTAQDVSRHLNDRSSVVVPVADNVVHLMYRPSDEVEREEFVRDCNYGPAGPAGNQRITSTDFPARGIVIWQGNGDAATTVQTGAGGTYYEGGSTRTDLHLAGSNYSLWTQGSNVNYVTSEHGNAFGTVDVQPTDMNNTFNNGSGFVQNTTNYSLGRTAATIEYDCILESGSTLGTLRMLEHAGDAGSSTTDYPKIDIFTGYRCADVEIRLEVLNSYGGYEWHTVYNSDDSLTTSNWSTGSSQHPYWLRCIIDGRPAPPMGAHTQPTIGWNSVFRRMRVRMKNFYDDPHPPATELPPGSNPAHWFDVHLNVRIMYNYKNMYLNHYTKKSYNSTTGYLTGSAVTGVNLGTQTDVTTQGNQVTVSGTAVTVPRVQEFLVSITAVVEYCGTAVPTDTLSLARGSVPRPIDSFVGTAYATPTVPSVTTGKRKVPDSARDTGQIPMSKRVHPNRPRGMSPPRVSGKRTVPDSAFVEEQGPSTRAHRRGRKRSPASSPRSPSRDKRWRDDYDFDSE